MKTIYFITPYPYDEAPSQRFRFEQYLSILSQNGYRYKIKPFLNTANWRTIYASGQYLKKLWLMVDGWFHRIKLLFQLKHVDFVFIHREATPFGPPIIEWIIAKVLRKKIIYDFDDAIWQTDKSGESIFEQLIRWRSKVGSICKWSFRVSCGNDYLCQYARQFNSNVVRNVTTIDTDNVHQNALHQTNRETSRVTIGWTGSHSTLKYLTALSDVLKVIVNNFPEVDVLVIADKEPELQLPRVTFRPWSKATEISDLMKIDIGVMPLPDDRWAKGKCGFKALQYMALEIPSVVSPVGVNSIIIEDGTNGFLCNSSQEWISVLSSLIEDGALRKKIGAAGRTTVLKSYSVNANTSLFLSLFQE